MAGKIKVGFIGLGQRGAGLYIEGGGLMGTTFAFDNVQITAVCDGFADRVARAASIVEEKGFPRPFETTDYQEILKQELDVVIISAAWEAHVPLAVAAMKAGVITALEVGGGYSIEDCFALVRAYEETQTPFMFLENCCYGKRELMVTNMARQGELGEISYCHGSYCHDLREEISGGAKTKHYRLRNYLIRNCDNYPTHNLGPIAKLLNINRGNRMLTLTSMASKSRGLNAYAVGKEGMEFLQHAQIQQGDVVHTSIICADGTLITLKLDTTLPRAYCRELTVSGTAGMYSEAGDVLLTEKKGFNHESSLNDYLHSALEYEEQYLPEIWKNITPEEIEIGHGGMDFLMLRELFTAIERGAEMPIDVYDAASWMAITALSEQSIAMGGTPVSIPDFTGGRWVMRPSKDVIDFTKVS